MDYFPPLCMVEDQIPHHMAAGGGCSGGGAEVAPSCPRCASSNTKFCYYNNYSLTQPRYLCKSCRRYWTRGGSLRNVPIGGGCRKSRRTKAASKTGSPSGRINTNNGYPAAGSSSEPSADIDMATVFANFLKNQTSSSADSVGGQDSDPVSNDVDRPRFEAEPEPAAGHNKILDPVENDENALVFPHDDDQQQQQGGDQEAGLLWSDATSSEMSNFMMTWQLVDTPFPSDEFYWSSGFDFSGLEEVLSGPSSPSNAQH